MADGLIRQKGGFTVVGNTVAKDPRLSFKAKGLYLFIQSYITLPDKKWTKKEFLDMAPEGVKAFEGAWKELKEAGYLKTHVYTINGVFTNEYEILDKPDLGPHTLYYDTKGKLTKTNLDIPSKKETSDKQEIPYTQNGIYGNGIYGNGTSANGSNINKDLKTNTISEKKKTTVNQYTTSYTPRVKAMSLKDSLLVDSKVPDG